MAVFEKDTSPARKAMAWGLIATWIVCGVIMIVGERNARAVSPTTFLTAIVLFFGSIVLALIVAQIRIARDPALAARVARANDPDVPRSDAGRRLRIARTIVAWLTAFGVIAWRTPFFHPLTGNLFFVFEFLTLLAFVLPMCIEAEAFANGGMQSRRPRRFISRYKNPIRFWFGVLVIGIAPLVWVTIQGAMFAGVLRIGPALSHALIAAPSSAPADFRPAAD